MADDISMFKWFLEELDHAKFGSVKSYMKVLLLSWLSNMEGHKI